MEGKRQPLVGALLLNLVAAVVSGQFSYGDRYGGRDYDYGSGGGGNAVDVGCPDFGPMDSFNAEGLQRGKVGPAPIVALTHCPIEISPALLIRRATTTVPAG